MPLDAARSTGRAGSRVYAFGAGRGGNDTELDAGGELAMIQLNSVATTTLGDALVGS